MCGKLICAETEYEARAITVISAVPNPNAAPCNASNKKPIAEATAQDQLKDAVKSRGENR
jgi:hypothetical protein